MGIPLTPHRASPSGESLSIRQAAASDAENVAAILCEAARGLEESDTPMWRDDELKAARIAGDVADGLFFLAEHSGEPAGIVKFQLEDPIFWPDLPQSEAAYIHRLAVRRRFAGRGVSTAF